MIQIVALDLDDTLLRSDKSLAAETIELLHVLEERDIRVVVATGRPPRSVAEALPSELHHIPWICYNGAEIYENGEKIYENLLSVDDTRQIVESFEKLLPTSALGLEIDDVLYMNRESDRWRVYQQANLLEIATRPSAKVLFFEENFSLLDPLLTSLPPNARAMLSHKYRLVQILARNADKAEALRFMTKRWDMDLVNVVAFGDDVNDVDMVREAGIGVAVANAVAEVKEVANRVTLSNDDDGVGIVLRELFLPRTELA